MSTMDGTERHRPRRLPSRAALGCAAMGVAFALAVPVSGAGAVYITMDAEKTAAGSTKLCVGLQSGGQPAVGTQNDLVWDSSCATLKANSCATAPDSKKPLHGSVPANMPATYRALVFALDNVDPIRDGTLYCCEFEVAAAGDGCCAVGLAHLAVSDSQGGAIPPEAKPARLCLASMSAAPLAATPPAAAPLPAGGANWLWLLAAAIAALAVAMLIMRGRRK